MDKTPKSTTTVQDFVKQARKLSLTDAKTIIKSLESTFNESKKAIVEKAGAAAKSTAKKTPKKKSIFSTLEEVDKLKLKAADAMIDVISYICGR